LSERGAYELEDVVGSADELDSRIVRGSAWVAVSYGGRNLVTLVTMLALVRLLEPHAFGLVALASVVLIICNQVQDAGTAAALVYRRNDVERAAGTTLVFSTLSSLVLYGVAFAVAPFVARIFHAPELTEVLRVMALMLPVRGIGATPSAILERNIDFRRRAKCDVSGALAQAAFALSLAVGGAGVWSLVVGQLAGTVVQAAIGWLVVPWRPNPRLASFTLWREMLRYGRFVSGTNVVNLVNNTIDNVLVGRLLGATTLGFYAVSFRLADFPNTVIAHIVGRVMFPVYSLLQGELDRFRRAYIQNLQRIAIFALPVSVTIVVAADPIVHTLFGDRWAAIVTPLRILGIYGLIKSFSAPSGEVFKGAGRPHLGLVFGLMQVAVALPTLLLLVPAYGITGAAVGMLVTMTVVGSVRLLVSLRLVGATVGGLARSLAPSVLCAGVLAATLAALMPAAEMLSDAAGLALLVGGAAAAYVGAILAFARSVVGPLWGGLRGVGASVTR
jgi:O-antigen/teichoic acid export membrane protein